MPRRAADLVKMSLNLPRETYEQLKKLAEEHHVSMTEIVRNGIESERCLLVHPFARKWLQRLGQNVPADAEPIRTLA
jgi:hypothetical protein